MAPHQTAPRTNTLIAAHLPSSAFADAAFLHALRALFARYGPLYAFAPIKVFRRCIVTFWNPHDAERCKRDVDGLMLPASSSSSSNNPTQMRVFRGANTPLRQPTSRPTSPNPDDPDPFFLAPPRLEKNFLISPPGSPPVGWEQIVEDPPNAAPLATDLINALEKLRVAREDGAFGLGPGVEIVYDAPGGEGIGITVSVIDCDAEDEDAEMDDEEDGPRTQDEWRSGRRSGFAVSGERARIVPTALPPRNGPIRIPPRSATPLPPMRG